MLSRFALTTLKSAFKIPLETLSEFLFELSSMLFKTFCLGVFLMVLFKAVARITRQTIAHGRGGCQKISRGTDATARGAGGEGGAGAKDQ